MVLTTCVRRFKTLQRLGFSNAVRLIKQRHKNATFNATWRKKYTKTVESSTRLYAKTGHAWQDIAQQQGCTPSFEQFFNQQRMRSLPVLEPLLTSISDDEYKHRADEYVCNEFAVLGSEKRLFEVGIPWHEDIRLSSQNASADARFDATSWYKKIEINANVTHHMVKDIKVPWELSRLQHLVVLGCAYTTTYDERYAIAFEEHVRSWMIANPFLRGINWACPMEVALRATSLVIAFTSFRRSPVVSDDFWLGYVTNLYDHMIYLENNWELYDLRTSNHYIADLVGYLYLCWFFNDCPATATRATWCHQELLAELNKQINPDGSSYEQATAYHRLVTELFYHHKLIAQQLRLPIPAESQQKFRSMCAYLQWCTPQGGKLITIGDNDSGVVTVAGLPEAIIDQLSRFNKSTSVYLGHNRGASIDSQSPDCASAYTDSSGVCRSEQTQENATPYGLCHFDNVGLSIIKTTAWHVSLRHTVYNEQEPTCHMHNDATSITLAYDGVPFIVDPGSYVYTPSIVWRNLFRSVQSHSGMYLSNVLQPIEPVALDDNIFLLRRAPATMPAQEAIVGTEKLSMHTTHDDYFGYRPERRVMLDEQSSTVTLHDQWYVQDLTTKNQKTTTQDSSKNLSVSSDVVNSPLYACFQFVLHPDVKATKITKPGSSGNNAVWLLESGGITLELASDQLVYELRPAWYSPEYGVKVATQMLFARYELAVVTPSDLRPEFCTNIRYQGVK